MKILQIIYSLSSGGAERFVVDLSNELAELGHDVTLCVLREDELNIANKFYKNDISTKVNYLNLKIPEGFRLSNVGVFYRLIKQLNPDAVHCHLNLVNYFFPLTFVLKKVKFVHTIHNEAHREVNSKMEYWIRRLFYTTKWMNAVTISQETSKSFVSYYNTMNYVEIHNGRKQLIPTEEFEAVADYMNSFKKKNETIFIHVARCAPAKNQKALINVFNRLIYEGQSARLFIIGDGFDSDLGDELRSIATDKVVFLGTKRNVGDYFFNADAFCLSSLWEGMPITLIEAMACGCTPLCTPVGGIVNAIEHGITGFLSKSVSEEDYYQTMMCFLVDGKNINKEKLIENFRSRYSIEHCAKQYAALYLQ